MISLKKYLDAAANGSLKHSEPEADKSALAFAAAVAVYGSTLLEMGSCSQNVCLVTGGETKRALEKVKESLSVTMSPADLEATGKNVEEELQEWARRTTNHYRQKAKEVKDLLLTMARAASAVGERDARCANQIDEVTNRLTKIASLDDLTQIRSSIEKSATELRASVARMTAEGKATVEQLRTEIVSYQVKLEEAEEIASRDALTGLRSRMNVEGHIERRIDSGASFCVSIIDVDEFKRVNDEHGHLAGDELLKQFAAELRLRSRSSDVIGRWGGDEFIILHDCGLPEAAAQTDRLGGWISGSYTVQGRSGPVKLKVHSSIGLAQHQAGERMRDLLARADNEMYLQKAATREVGAGSFR